MKKLISQLTPAERAIWIISALSVIISYAVFGGGSVVKLITTLVGVTALVFVAKGYVIGQILTIVFAVMYGVVSYWFRYYGEMITYLLMTAPMAFLAAAEWIKNPYKNTREVRVKAIGKKEGAVMMILGAAVTAVFYFILKALDTPNLFFSTLSITTSFAASYLTYKRSPFYGAAYAANDIVLIVLWALAAVDDISYISMAVCFGAFFLNDIYGFINWKRMEKRQKE